MGFRDEWLEEDEGLQQYLVVAVGWFEWEFCGCLVVLHSGRGLIFGFAKSEIQGLELGCVGWLPKGLLRLNFYGRY